MFNNESIFLKLSGRYVKYSGKYLFFGYKGDEEQYETSEIYNVPDPSIDSTFKYLFTHKETKILENMLNSLLFPDSPKLSDLEIIDNEVTRPGKKHNKGTFRSDIVCKAVLDGNEIIIISIEMQIGMYGDFTERLFKYNIALSYKNDFKKVWSLGLFITLTKSRIHSSNTKLNKIQNGEKKELDYLKLIEIDLKDEINNIEKGKEVKVNGKEIGNNGKEWLKLLGLRTWCSTQLDKYILPKNFKLSNNATFNEALFKLLNIPKEIFIESIDIERDIMNYTKELEDNRLEGKEEGKIATLIISAFNLFKENCEKSIFIILGKEKFKKSEILLNLNQFEGQDDIKKNFISFLKENNYLSN